MPTRAQWHPVLSCISCPVGSSRCSLKCFVPLASTRRGAFLCTARYFELLFMPPSEHLSHSFRVGVIFAHLLLKVTAPHTHTQTDTQTHIHTCTHMRTHTHTAAFELVAAFPLCPHTFPRCSFHALCSGCLRFDGFIVAWFCNPCRVHTLPMFQQDQHIAQHPSICVVVYRN